MTNVLYYISFDSYADRIDGQAVLSYTPTKLLDVNLSGIVKQGLYPTIEAHI